jgi:hypothetical protein
MLKLVVVLFNLKNGMDPVDIRTQLDLDRVTEKTDALCNESLGSKSERSVRIHSVGSIEESSIISHATPSVQQYNNILSSINQTKTLEHQHSAKVMPDPT